MNWEAVTVIGAIVVVLGAILFPLGLLLGRRAARKNRKNSSGRIITRAGFIYFGTFVLLLLLGLTVPALFQDSWLQKKVGTAPLIIGYYGLLIIASQQIELGLKRRGIQITRAAEKKDT